MVKDLLKPRLEEYLQAIGSHKDKRAGKDMFICPLCHSGEGKNGALHVTGEKWYCHSCSNGGDIFTLAGLMNDTKDFKEQLKLVCDTLNISFTDTLQPKERKPMPQATPQQKPSINYTEFLNACSAIGADYFLQRGISAKTIQRYKLGTIDTATLAHYTASLKLSKGLRVGDVTIPYFDEQGNYIYFIVRATNIKPNEKSDYPKFKKPQSEHAGAEPVYNYPALFQKDKPVFICEGQIDALSIVDVGGEAIAVGGTGTDKLEQYIKQIACPGLILALDNDEAGKRATEKITTLLNAHNIPYSVFQHQAGTKDINAALLQNKSKLAGQVTYYNRKYSNDRHQAEANKLPASEFVQDLLNQIKERKQSKSISTGFSNIDELLDGGLREGLYFIGAVSSLGKTALVLQIADNIAAAGNDVLFISLEMARSELMARSISRRTYQYALNTYPLDFFREGQGTIPTTALTTAGVLQGNIRQGNQAQAFEFAVNTYAHNEAQHLFIVEGVGNIGYKQVRQYIEQHQATHGTLPVVVVDYIQLLGIADESNASDKQKIDKAVMELKRISRDFNIPIIGISSLNRESYNKAMSMSAFKESGAVEYTADVLIGLQLNGIENKSAEFDKLIQENEDKIKKAMPIKVDFKILKNRNGRRGTTQLDFVSMFNFYDEATAEKKEEPPKKQVTRF